MARDYPTGLADPGDRRYCSAVSTTSTPPNGPSSSDPPVWAAGATCPNVGGTQWSIIGAAGGSTPNNTVLTRGVPNGTDGNDLTDTNIRGWKVCATLERSNRVFCKSNTIR